MTSPGLDTGGGLHPGNDPRSALVESAFDLDNIPKDYLRDSQPLHPLNHPWTPIEPFTLTEPLRPIWFNPKWEAIAGHRDLLDCITVDDGRRLGDWLTGASGRDSRASLHESWSVHKEEILSEARSREHMDPVAQQLTSKKGSPYGGGYNPLGQEALERPPDESDTIVVEFSFPRGKAKLELVLASLPLHERHGLSATNSIAVVTTIVRSNYELFRARPLEWAQPVAPDEVDSPRTETFHPISPKQSAVLFNGHKVTHNWVSGNPIYIKNDGSIHPQPPPIETIHPCGLPLDVRTLFWQKDWSQTPLGPMSQWPATLRMVLGLCMGFPVRVCVWWGRDLTMIYNEAFAQNYSKHPQGYGASGTEAWSDLWGTLGPLTELLLSGTSIYRDDDLYLYKDLATGRTFETYRSGVWSCVMNDQGEFGGIWHATRDSTMKLVSDRRVELLHDLSERTSGRTLHDFKRGVLETLDAHPKEAPFALLYFVETTLDSVQLRYGGGIGIPESHPTAPEVITDLESAPWPFADVLRTRRSTVVDDLNLEGYTPRVWSELPTEAVLVPISLNSEFDIPGAVLVLGLSCRLPYDASYKAFVQELRFQMASQLSAVRLCNADQQRIDDLALLDRAKSTLFSNVSDELLTPITLISGPLDDLMVDMPEGPKLDMLHIARRNIRRLTRLVEMIVDVSRLDHGRLKGTFQRENLGVVTSGIAGLFHKPAASGRIAYTIYCDETPMETFVDREQWEKTLFVLIGDAIKSASSAVSVRLSYSKTHAIAIIEGDEVAEAGISLAFVKKLVELHGGELHVRGGTYEVKLPLGSAHLGSDSLASPSFVPRPIPPDFRDDVIDDLRLLRTSSIAESQSTDSKASVSLRDTLYFCRDDVIMVVDDIPDSRRYMVSILEPFCTVVEATDGVDALQKYGQWNPNLIIVDAVMPRLDGCGLIDELRLGTAAQRTVPVIMLTADCRSSGSGADDTITKPFNARELIARAHMQLQLGKKRRDWEVLFEERTNQLRLLTEESPMGIFRCNSDGVLIYANNAYLTQLGLPPDALEQWHQCLVERNFVHGLWREYVDSTSPKFEIECQWLNGKWSHATILRIGDRRAGFVGCLVDLTDRKLREEMHRQRVVEAEMRRAEAEEARQQQELLIDITSHEIRNPISSLMQMSLPYCSSLVKTNLLFLREQLVAGTLQATDQLLATLDEDLEALDNIYQCGLAQERISNDVLSLGKIQLDMLQMFDVETNICKEAHKAVSIFQNEARMHHIALSLDISPAFDELGIETVMTDPVRLGQVVTNLLSNATRFTANSVMRRVNLSVDIGLDPPLSGSCLKPVPCTRPPVLKEGMPMYVYIAVSDTGPGLTPAELENLFQRFSQASPMTHTVFGGSGLGLFVCRKLAERMGGRIEVTSEYGKGSVFRFYVCCNLGRLRSVFRNGGIGAGPANSAANSAVNSAANSRSHTPCATPPPIQRSPGRILVVEDNLINRKVLLRQLTHVGMATDWASNGLEGLEKIRAAMRGDTLPYDCVLMDLEMPVMDGYTAVRHVREDEDAAGAAEMRHSIVALTGNARQAQIDENMSDFDDVVVKPYRLDDLLQTIERVRVRGEEQERRLPMSWYALRRSSV